MHRVPLFDFGDDLVGIAGDEALGGAIDDEVEGFHHDGADEGGVAVGLDNGAEDVVAAGVGEADAAGHGSVGGAAVGVADLDGAGDFEAQFLGDGSGDDQVARRRYRRRRGR